MIGELIFNYTTFSADHNALIVAWCIVGYLIASFGYYIVSKSNSKAEMNNSISKINSAKRDTEYELKKAESVLYEFNSLLK
jgi:hypothetical protein